MVGIIGVVTPTVAMDLVPGIIIGVTTPPVAVAARATIVSRTADQDRVRTVAPVHANAVMMGAVMGAVIVATGVILEVIMVVVDT